MLFIHQPNYGDFLNEETDREAEIFAQSYPASQQESHKGNCTLYLPNLGLFPMQLGCSHTPTRRTEGPETQGQESESQSPARDFEW